MEAVEPFRRGILRQMSRTDGRILDKGHDLTNMKKSRFYRDFLMVSSRAFGTSFCHQFSSFLGIMMSSRDDFLGSFFPKVRLYPLWWPWRDSNPWMQPWEGWDLSRLSTGPYALPCKAWIIYRIGRILASNSFLYSLYMIYFSLRFLAQVTIDADLVDKSSMPHTSSGLAHPG